MPNPQYYRLMKNNKIVGFKRVTTEYLAVESTKWQLDPIDHNHFEEQKLSKHPKGINGYPLAMDWAEAIRHLNKIKSQLNASINGTGGWYIDRIRYLVGRFDDGERSEELYQEMMALK